MIDVTQNQDGSFNITWDENDPKESILNQYTQDDFKALIQNYLERKEQEDKYVQQRYKRQNPTIFRDKPIKGSIDPEDNITEATKEDYEDFWYNSESEGKEGFGFRI